MRDLQKRHVGMLRSVKREAERVVREKWGVGRGGLRCYIHYQPSYCESLAELRLFLLDAPFHTGVGSSDDLTH